MVEYVGDRTEVPVRKADLHQQGTSFDRTADNPTGADYMVPVDPGTTEVGGKGLVPMTRPMQVDAWKGAPEIRAPGGETGRQDNPPDEQGVNSPSSIGVPQSKPSWQGDGGRGPDPQPPRPSGHPALR
jgi:hypothetical protein